MTNLPLLKDMIFPSLLTITKGVKIKKEGISIKKIIKNVEIDRIALERYTQFFAWQEECPLAFFYLMAQRAQTSLMLQADFTIAIPGLVHISNRLEKLGTIDSNAPFDLDVKIEVAYKEAGSLIPKCTVLFMQKNQPVIRCESTYIAKRKGGMNAKTRMDIDEALTKPFLSETWEIAKNLGQIYAAASGDKNPIHTSKFFAKIIGFRSPILQGWYSVSRIVKAYEMANNTTYDFIEVDFKSPIFLPSQQKVEGQKTGTNDVLFQINDVATDKIILKVKLKLERH
jgi:acyl dehydratase